MYFILFPFPAAPELSSSLLLKWPSPQFCTFASNILVCYDVKMCFSLMYQLVLWSLRTLLSLLLSSEVLFELTQGVH